MDCVLRGVRCVVVIGCALALVSCGGSGDTEPSAEVFILDGLVAQYGSEAPCYGQGAVSHQERCSSDGVVSIEPAYPVVSVSLDAFAIDQSEVSNAQYRACVDAEACEDALFTDSFEQGDDYYTNEAFNDYPVNHVTWEMAHAYCEYQGRRLPTDMEWQRVAQGSSERSGALRELPAEGLESIEACAEDGRDFSGYACDKSGFGFEASNFVPVGSPGEDYVNEGYMADLQPGRIYHLFSNVSEFTSTPYQADVTCKEPLPMTDTPLGSTEGLADCISCVECQGLSGEDRIQCEQECKWCEACEGEFSDGTPYRPDGYSLGPLPCHIDCQGELREAPRCVSWTEDEMPIAAEALKGSGTLMIVRGGHVGVLTTGTDSCRFNADYRQERVPQAGSAADQDRTTQKGLGFRCARTLSDEEANAMRTELTP